MKSPQLKLELGLEPSLWEQLGFDNYEASSEWLNEDYYTQATYYESYNKRIYDAWSKCWSHANFIANDPDSTERERAFAQMVFEVMCNARAIPIVECRVDINGESTIIRNQLD